MRLAVISDIHGECFVLDQVLQDIRRQGIEQMVCLGDALQGGSRPAETLVRLRELNCPVVMGNADAWLLTGQNPSAGEEPSEQQREVRAWSLAHLSPSDLAFVQQFRPTLEIPLEAGKTLLCFHCSPRSFDEIILPETPDDVVRQFLGGYDATLFTGGHTHTQQMRRLGIQVPDEMAVVGVDNDDVICDLCDPPLSSVRIPLVSMAREATHILVRSIQHQTTDTERATFRPELVLRASTTDRRAEQVQLIDPRCEAAENRAPALSV